jgi:AcrR family transcriptional regulator
LPASAQPTLQPRKSPVQARSAASVDAMLEATLQVLVSVGKERLTTTRVAERAGVSVGTLYQYFPNKSSLLQATLRRHFENVFAAVTEVCRQQRGNSLAVMGAALADSFLAAKMADGKASVALYAVSSDVDGMEIAQEVRLRSQHAVCSMLESATDGPLRDPSLATTVVLGLMSGLSRQLLETPSPERVYPSYRAELQSAVVAYLATCARHR